MMWYMRATDGTYSIQFIFEDFPLIKYLVESKIFPTSATTASCSSRDRGSKSWPTARQFSCASSLVKRVSSREYIFPPTSNLCESSVFWKCIHVIVHEKTEQNIIQELSNQFQSLKCYDAKESKLVFPGFCFVLFLYQKLYLAQNTLGLKLLGSFRLGISIWYFL